MTARAGERQARRPVPILVARPGGYAERFAAALGDRHPVLVFAAALLSGLLVLLVASILLALFVVHVLASGDGLGLGGSDESFNETLAAHRSGTLTTLAEIGAQLGAAVLVTFACLVAIACAITRRWRIAAFAIFALLLESATYYVTSFAVPRDRPSVPRLEKLEVDTSYPSGHTAAAVAVYAGLVLLLTSRFTDSLTRALAWTGAILLITFIALSRMYEGMHHPLDVAGGVLVGDRRDPGGAVRLPRSRGGGREAAAGMKVAVVAHAGKTLGGGLPELRRTLAEAGITEPLWVEVPKAKRAPAAVERVLAEGAELLLAWGGDGMVRRCINALGDTQVPLAIVPAGTSNLFATNLGIESDIAAAVQVALLGERRRLDVGRFAGERFAVMAGAGFDAAMIKGSDELKDRLGRGAYVLGGATQLNAAGFEAKIKIDGTRWYKGPASCVLVGNVGALFGGIEVFADAKPDDGLLDVGVLTSEGPAAAGARGRADGARQRREVAVRAGHPGAQGARQARPQGPL